MQKTVAELTQRAHAVIDSAFEAGAEVMVPLLSGGHDSYTAVRICSFHPRFTGDVYHIDTGIGALATRKFINEICDDHGWNLHIFESPETYGKFVRDRGFPGPGRHAWVYNRIKERCVRQIMGLFPKKNVALITGCRKQESERRMGTVEPLKIGEPSPSTGKVANKRRYWTAPCHDFSSGDQSAFMDRHDLPRNPIKMSPIGMSGECFCGAFARPNEIEMIRKYAPDVAQEIDRLAVIARECGKHAIWGTRPDRKKGVVVTQTGPLCNSCDARAMSAGLIIDQSLTPLRPREGRCRK